MRERPIQDLVDGLIQLGVDAQCTAGTGCPPVTVNAKGLPSGKVQVSYTAHDVLAQKTLFCKDQACPAHTQILVRCGAYISLLLLSVIFWAMAVSK